MNFDRAQLWTYAENYIHGKMNAEELHRLNEFLASQPDMKQEWDECIQTLNVLNDMSQHQALKAKIQSVHFNHKAEILTQAPPAKKINFTPKQFKLLKNVAAVAAIFVISSIISTQILFKDKVDEQANEFISLKRDIQHIKLSQEQLKQTIDDKETKDKSIVNSGNFSGTGFAISNEGYLVTDYHVIDKADSVYVKVNNDNYQKAYLVAFDAHSDIAILKMYDDKFKFTKTDLPYNLLNNSAPVAQSIFSIGYPQDNVFYTEGYISSHTGVDGSQVQYQLELPAHPGQSGSPIFDQTGEIIGMLLGKKVYATYAVKSSSIIELVQSLPKEHKIKLSAKNHLKGLPRTEQVKRANEFVFPVLVFKS